jgi:hypothetical protein
MVTTKKKKINGLEKLSARRDHFVSFILNLKMFFSCLKQAHTFSLSLAQQAHLVQTIENHFISIIVVWISFLLFFVRSFIFILFSISFFYSRSFISFPSFHPFLSFTHYDHFQSSNFMISSTHLSKITSPSPLPIFAACKRSRASTHACLPYVVTRPRSPSFTSSAPHLSI